MKITYEKGYIEQGLFKGCSYVIYKRAEHYELYVDRQFWSSGDSLREIEDELSDISKDWKGVM